MPKLLLHICCAPDMAWGLHELRSRYDIRCYWYNPNIHPEAEYQKRLDEAVKVARHFDIDLHAGRYDPGAWEDAIAGVEETPEQGERCARCFALRLKKAAEFCRQEKIAVFGTVLSVSPHKQVAMIDAAGVKAANDTTVEYHGFNLKKNNGFAGSVRLSKELGIYRQDYCGCRLSLKERDERSARKGC